MNTDQFLKTNQAFCAKIDGVMRVETIRISEREVKQTVMRMCGIISNCQEPDCDCVDKAWQKHIDQSKVDIVPVTVEEGVKVG